MKNFVFKTILFFSCFSLSTQIRAQVAITAVPFLEINNDTRSMGMAGANVALKGGRSGMHLNPATIGKMGHIEISSQLNLNSSDSFFGTDWLPSFNASDVYIYSPQIIVGYKGLSIGYQYTYINLGDQVQTSSSNNEEISSFSAYEYAHTLATAFDIGKYFALGVGINYVRSNLSTRTAIEGHKTSPVTSITFDLGVYSEYPFDIDFVKITPTLGWSLTDLGHPKRYSESFQEDALPIIMRGGIGLRFDIEKKLFGLKALSIGSYGSLEKIMARSEDDGTPYGPLKAVFGSWGPYEVFNGQDIITLSLKEQFRRSSGLEVTLLEVFSLRWGHFYENPNNGGREYDTMGIGFYAGIFSLEYAEIRIDEMDHPLKGTQYFQLTLDIPIQYFRNFKTSSRQ